MLASGCGYRSVLAARAPQHFAVLAGQTLIPETIAVQAALSGARSELATGGQLAQDTGSPRLVIDVLRVDEVSRGIHVQGGQPVAAGMSIAVVVRARVFAGDNQEPTVDTGDLRRGVQVSGDADPRADSAAYDVALRSAAERAGRAAARAALGFPEPADELP
ncbi:MAG: hypothetical protein ABJB12_01510 [Pseudomonadota bacterium]